MSFFQSRFTCVGLCLLSSVLIAQQPDTSRSSALAAAAVPRLVNFSGRVADAQGKPIAGIAGVTFAIYQDQYQGPALWLETQNVTADARGNYTVQLGATKPAGLPLDLFTSGEAHWLGVQVSGQAEQARALLLSVPYALKAADAETIGGLPPSAFVLAASAAVNGGSGSNRGTAISSAAVPPASSDVTTTGGTVNALPLFTTATNVQSSAIAQTGTGTTAKIGIGNSAPAATLDISGSETIRGLLTLPATGVATPAAGKSSQAQEFVASSFSSTTSAALNQTFLWQAEQANNNTANPGATLNLLYGLGTVKPAETGLRIGPKGIIAFAPGQTFPGGSGSGSVTSVGLSAPTSDFTVSGSPITSSGTLGLNWNVAPTNAGTANAIVKRDATGSFNAGGITASLGVTGISASATSAGVSGENPSGGYGVYGVASGTTGQGVWGESFGTTNANGNGPDGVHGVTHSGAGAGVAGLSDGAGGIGVYAQGRGYGVYGVAGDNGHSLANGTGVYGSSYFGSGVAGASSSGAGVSGTSSIGPGVYGSNPNGFGFATDSNVQQARGAGGWIKAMVYIDSRDNANTIVRCFNSTLAGAAATTPPCGFNVVDPPLDYGRGIDFGFQVDDRFIVSQSSYNRNMMTLCVDTDPDCHAYDYVPTSTQVLVQCWDSDGNEYGNRFYVVVY
jgi:hypothetical protein